MNKMVKLALGSVLAFEAIRTITAKLSWGKVYYGSATPGNDNVIKEEDIID